jgi:hypothetical protein
MGAAHEVVEFPGNIEALCGAAVSYCRVIDCPAEAGYLSRGHPSLGDPEYDNWDGGTWYWPLRIELDLQDFGTIKGPEARQVLEKRIEVILDHIARLRANR